MHLFISRFPSSNFDLKISYHEKPNIIQILLGSLVNTFDWVLYEYKKNLYKLMKRYYIDTVRFCINKVYSNNAHHCIMFITLAVLTNMS